MIELFQKFAEHEAEPRTNARASALASMLQKDEALLRLFGQSQHFPNVGKCCALSPRAKRAGLFFLLIYYFYPKAFKKSEDLGILPYIEKIVSFGVLDGEDFLRHFGSI